MDGNDGKNYTLFELNHTIRKTIGAMMLRLFIRQVYRVTSNIDL